MNSFADLCFTAYFIVQSVPPSVFQLLWHLSCTVVQINTQNVSKPAIIIDAGVHAREWISPASVMYFTEACIDVSVSVCRYSVWMFRCLQNQFVETKNLILFETSSGILVITLQNVKVKRFYCTVLLASSPSSESWRLRVQSHQGPVLEEEQTEEQRL